MNITELKKLIEEMSDETIAALSSAYSEPRKMKERILNALASFDEIYGDMGEVSLLSVPGRSEILGNHTDHNNGMVLAGAIDKDIIAVVAKNGENKVVLKSEGYKINEVDLSLIADKDAYGKYNSSSLISGVAKGFTDNGYEVGGFCAYTTSDVLSGSGISSSAAFEVMVGNIFNYLYNGGKVKNENIAKIAQFAENEYFGKPSGLMDQMACAVGGFVFMDFEDPKKPKIEPISFSLSEAGYALCIVNTGANHANLNDDYASVPTEMRSVAKILNKSVLRGADESDVIANVSEIRRIAGDRALLRAVHYIRENKRVLSARDALVNKDADAFFKNVIASGKSSFEYLQNVYTVKNVSEQGLSLALLFTEGFLCERGGAFRVHGGGFAGTIQAYVKKEDVNEYVSLMEGIFGVGTVMCLSIRSVGACKLF